MTEAVEKRAIAFIRTIGNRCAGCLRRSRENCRNCISSWANDILREYESEVAPGIDYSLAARMMMIADSLKGGPAPSRAIDLKKFCTKQLKRWTLCYMVRRGILERERADGEEYVYKLVKKPM